MKKHSPITPAIHLVLLFALAAFFFFSCQKSHAQPTPDTGTNMPPYSALKSLLAGAPTHWTVATYGTYVPTLKHPYGGGAALVYGMNDYVGTQIRLQYLNIADEVGQYWQPSGVVNFTVPIHWRQFTFRPLADAGVAMDSKCHPYSIYGAGAEVGWKTLAIFAGTERWTGPQNSFTAYQLGLAWHITF